MDKTLPSLAEAVAKIGDGATVMIGGFGGSGAPIELIRALIERFKATGSPKALTVINNNAGNGRIGIAAMIDLGMVAKMICSFPRSADPVVFTQMYLAGKIALELVPQGTLAERIRAGGAGIPAFFTKTGVGTVVAEGNEDRLYVIVRRVVNGNTVRYIERMASRHFDSLEDAFFVDSGATYDGTNTTATTVTVSGGTTWGPADVLTITASSPLFTFPGTSDVGDAIVLTDAAGKKYRLTIRSTTSTTVATARVDVTLPVALRNTATALYSFARNTISGLSWLEGKTVSILADGAVQPQKVVTSGTITIDRASSIIHIGLPIEADLQSLPLAMGIDNGMGQGRYKNVNKAWLRVYQSSGIFIGPDPDNLVEAKQRTTEPYGTPPELKTQEIQIMLTPSWLDSGQVFIRQSDPLPLTIVGMTLEVAIGG